MLTLELGRVEIGLLLGGLGLVCIACGLVAWLLWRQHRQLQHSITGICGQVAAFADASMSVAQTVEQSLVMTPQTRASANEAKGAAGRRELLQVAARRLSQQQPPAVVQQALGLKDDELKLLCLGAANPLMPVESGLASTSTQHLPNDPLPNFSLQNPSLANPSSANKGAPRAVA